MPFFYFHDDSLRRYSRQFAEVDICAMEPSRKRLKRMAWRRNLAGDPTTVEGVLAEIRGTPAPPIAPIRMVAPAVVGGAARPVVVVRRPAETDRVEKAGCGGRLWW